MTSPGPPTTTPRRGVGSGLTAIGVVLVMTFVWWLVSGNGPQGPRGSDPTYAVPEESASAGRANVGSAASPGPKLTNPNGVRIDGFVLDGPTRLVLSYTSGDPECYGRIDTPEVLETDGSVTVTLTLVPPASPPDRCPDGALHEEVPVDLDTALGDRSVLDASFAQRVRVAPADEPSD
jgi:hypothetical protein